MPCWLAVSREMAGDAGFRTVGACILRQHSLRRAASSMCTPTLHGAYALRMVSTPCRVRTYHENVVSDAALVRRRAEDLQLGEVHELAAAERTVRAVLIEVRDLR